MSDIVLETKLVGEIEGVFQVPSYQRGYRWGEEEVIRLLSDCYELIDGGIQSGKSYCLQPIVLRRSGECYHLIDGQQRLTTLYLIYHYMSAASGGWLVKSPRFSLEYETRKKSGEFLRQLDPARREENIDFHFIYQAYEVIQQWFTRFGDKMPVVMGDFNACLAKNVRVIWYETDGTEDEIRLFTRLNIGKIPLTSAELVKAMFLSQNGRMNLDSRRQEEAALRWDEIEKQLHNERLWYFLTNQSADIYQTKIELVLDLIAGKHEGTRDPYYTFFHFDNRRKLEDPEAMWREIQHTFLTLTDWYRNHELYHKIGYLISSRAKTLPELFEGAKGRTKRDFLKLLDDYIKESVAISKNYAELSYENAGERERISRVLLLFNVESVRRSVEASQWFPFDKFKIQRNGKAVWSLEHIHAQHSEGLRKLSDRRQWLALHIPSIRGLGSEYEMLAVQMESMLRNPTMDSMTFHALQKKTFAALSSNGSTEYLHSIGNLALLNCSDNAALGNAAFDAKRNEIIRLDQRGAFIPFCTRMAFLKYYTPSQENQIHFWGPADRRAYVSAINDMLGCYLREPIDLEPGEEDGVDGEGAD